MIRKRDVIEWKQDEVTKAYFNGIKERIREITSCLIDGTNIAPENSDHTVQMTNQFTGMIKGLKEALDVDLDEVIEEEEDAESIG